MESSRGVSHHQRESGSRGVTSSRGGEKEGGGSSSSGSLADCQRKSGDGGLGDHGGENSGGHSSKVKGILDAEAKQKAEAEAQAEEMEMEQGSKLLLKQKGQAGGKWVTCNHCMMWGFGCQVSFPQFWFDFLLMTGR